MADINDISSTRDIDSTNSMNNNIDGKNTYIKVNFSI